MCGDSIDTCEVARVYNALSLCIRAMGNVAIDVLVESDRPPWRCRGRSADLLICCETG